MGRVGARAVAVAWSFDAVPLAPVVAIAAIAVFNIVAVRRPVPPITTVGAQQAAFGLTVVAVTAIAVLT